jgi:predicted nucleic acid-binding protein
MIHFDTNFVIRAILPGSAADRQLRNWLSQGMKVGISCVAWAEFLCGPVTADEERIARALFPNPEPLLASDAGLAAALFNASGRRRGAILDCMIAATCIRLNAELATENINHFRPFLPHGLRLASTQP